MKTVLYLGPTEHQWWGRDRHGWHRLAGETDHPVWVVTDLAEESFAELEMPRLFGRDRTAFVARQLATRFPDTPYRTALPARSGTFMERLAPKRQTLLGIAGAERLNAELGAIDAPIAGVWPLSLLLADFCRSRHLPAELLAALPEPDALRIVFVRHRTPLLTRLAPTPDEGPAQLEEIARTQRYLENTRMLQRGEHACPVLLLGNAERFAGLPGSALHLVAPPSPWDVKPPADWRFPLFDLALRSPPGQVAPLVRRAAFVANHVRRAALAASAIGLVAAIGGAASNLRDIVDTTHKRERLAVGEQTLAARLAEAEKRLAGIDVAPEFLRRAIALDAEEIASAPALDQQLRTIAAALGKAPELRLKQLEWRLLAAGETPCTKSTAAAESEPAAERSAAAPSTRSVELGMEVHLPETYGPRDRAVALRNLSADLVRAGNIRVVKDPAQELAQGALLGGSAREAVHDPVWCLALPGAAPAKGTVGS